jgi:dATP pyrophosphohydrolase
LVVIHTDQLDCLLLERVTPAGFWQSVTGSLGWGEQPRQAALREVFEETGLVSGILEDAKHTERFEILPQWRHHYDATVTENVEHLFYYRVDGPPASVTLNPLEHTGHLWLDIDRAIEKTSSWTNRNALETLKRR